MNTFRIFIVGIVAVISAQALADRTDVVLSNTAKWTHYSIHKLEDGGARLDVCGFALKSDGGVTDEKCVGRDLQGANRTSALSMGDTSLNVWKADRGL